MIRCPRLGLIDLGTWELIDDCSAKCGEIGASETKFFTLKEMCSTSGVSSGTDSFILQLDDNPRNDGWLASVHTIK